MTIRIGAAIALAAVTAFAAPASATPVQFDIGWSSNIEGAGARAMLVIDDVVFGSAHEGDMLRASSFPGAGIISFDLTFTGGPSDGMTFDETQLDFVLATLGPIDVSLGADVFGHENFIDFNIFITEGEGPVGIFENTFQHPASALDDEPKIVRSLARSFFVEEPAEFSMTSFVSEGRTSEVPLPAAVWLLSAGVAGFGIMRRRRKA